METQKIYPLILAGGYGTRLWPLSREKFPKQFQSLIGQESLLQVTLKRLRNMHVHTSTLLCNKEHRFLVAEQLQQINIKAEMMLEPTPRNTAPSIAIGALHSLKKDPEAILLIMPSDHWISDDLDFSKAVNLAAVCAQQGNIVTFGIKPTRPETGYGYIEINPLEPVEQTILRFIEKPDLDQAQNYLESGNYLWNSGIYCLRADTYIAALEHYQPSILQAASEAYNKAIHDDDFIRIDEQAFAASPNISIDYAVMEKVNGSNAINAKVISIDGWSDIGSWRAIWDVSNKDECHNVVSGDVVALNSSNSYVRAEHRLVATIGIHDCIVVETDDAVLIADKNQIHLVKNIIEQLKINARSEHSEHLLVRRPWGSYECIDKAERYQVKRIMVNPGGALSLQMHHHRSEHWVVVKGVARITCGEKIFLLHENQSTYIPSGIPHRLENPGIIPLELIEVQSGSYLGEDDIIRLQDNYGRTNANMELQV
jgi:mannose-1-phosphate guanylyltransferase/mannose-6-phosphate isomerase